MTKYKAGYNLGMKMLKQAGIADAIRDAAGINPSRLKRMLAGGAGGLLGAGAGGAGGGVAALRALNAGILNPKLRLPGKLRDLIGRIPNPTPGKDELAHNISKWLMGFSLSAPVAIAEVAAHGAIPGAALGGYLGAKGGRKLLSALHNRGLSTPQRLLSRGIDLAEAHPLATAAAGAGGLGLAGYGGLKALSDD